jgi:hypothetical protein
MSKLTRDEKTAILMAQDIISIKDGIDEKDYTFICCILQGGTGLHGDGFKQYYNMNDDQFDSEFEERWKWIINDTNLNTTAILALSHVLNEEPIDLLKV